MLCSIIIPLYNKANFIEEALRSILNQTYQNFEIIVVDDGSSDDGVERVRAINDSRIMLVQQVNGGVSRARNKGISLAKGDLVCFLDADDWYLPQYLNAIVVMAQRYPELAFFATYYKRVHIERDEAKFWDVPDTIPMEVVDNLFQRWRSSILFNIDSFAARRKLLLEFQPCFPIDEQMGEDQDLYFRIAEKFSFVYCHLPLIGYRMEVNGSLCATYEGSCLFPAYLRLEQRALNKQMSERLIPAAIRLVAGARITVVRHSLIVGRRYQACKELLGVWRGMVSLRWWITLVMCLFATPTVVQRWEQWRNQKAHDG